MAICIHHHHHHHQYVYLCVLMSIFSHNTSGTVGEEMTKEHKKGECEVGEELMKPIFIHVIDGGMRRLVVGHAHSYARTYAPQARETPNKWALAQSRRLWQQSNVGEMLLSFFFSFSLYYKFQFAWLLDWCVVGLTVCQHNLIFNEKSAAQAHRS